MSDEDFYLPALAPYLKLARAPDENGEPSYTIHNPVSNNYFKIDWMAFECLSRMPLHSTAHGLQKAIEQETTLKITITQIRDIVDFLGRSGLLSLKDQKIIGQSTALPLWKKIFHQYLFFSLPLFRPQAFLEKTYKSIYWIHNPLFLKSMMLFLIIMVLATLPRMDEFFHTFSSLFSAQGAFAVLVIFAFIKIVHEFAHAFTAVRHGVKVPHMGIAFMVLYPVLYTETTGSWALSSRRARFEIGMAGIMAELCLAAIFLLVWHLSPAGGMGQALSFLIVCVSLVSSLIINLNPLMRFDGYYMLADATGFDNLQHRACAFARHTLRRILFGWNDASPEDLSAQDQKFLTVFGFALLIYRFFLFLGIAFLVYHIFFQPLGFFLMMAELVWFIFLPILSELKIWWKNRDRILSSKRSIFPAALASILFLACVIPWKSTVMLPAIVHAGLQEKIYPPSPARIERLYVKNGEEVAKGQILAELVSPKLEHDIRTARQELDRLEILRRRGQNMIEVLQDNQLSEIAIEKARLKVKALQEQKGRLVITSPFDGIIRDMDADIVEARYVAPSDTLFTIVNPQTTLITAYATEEVREKIRSDGTIKFVSDSRDRQIDGLSLQSVSDTGNTGIEWTELSSVHGGPIAADRDPQGVIVSRRALYEISAITNSAAPPFTERGFLRIASHPTSFFSTWINMLITLIRQETNAG